MKFTYLCFQPPLIAGVSGSLRGYKVKFRDVSSIQDFEERPVDADTTEYLLSDLKVFTAYEVAIGAFNDKNHGVWSPLYRWRSGEDCEYYTFFYKNNFIRTSRLKIPKN